MEKRAVCLFVSSVLVIVALSSPASALSTGYYVKYCSSTGGRLDFISMDTTIDASGNHTDECINATTLRKWFCDQGVARSIVHKCPTGCAEGACFTENANQQTYKFQCTATDPNVSFYVRGVVNGDKEDKCLSSHRLRKWFCKDNQATATVIICENGCDKGACIPGPTTSTTTSTTATSTTSTSTSTTLPAESTTTTLTTTSTVPAAGEPTATTLPATAPTETTTTTTTTSTTTTTTTSTTTTIPPTCLGPDSPRDFLKQYTTTDAMGTHTDSCIGFKRVQKWYCSNGRARSGYSRCARGCVYGACNPD